MRSFGRALIIVGGVLGAGAHARTLHYGDSAVELTSAKVTSPALHVQFEDGEMAYGALYNVNEYITPENTMRISYGDNGYWLGEWCEGDWFLPRKGYKCVPYLNRLFTLDEVKQFFPVTDLYSDWYAVSPLVAENRSPFTGGLDAGTYLFIIRGDLSCGKITDICGEELVAFNTAIGTFDHAISYRVEYQVNSVAIYLDTNNAEYTNWNIKFPSTSAWPYCGNKNLTNIDNLCDFPVTGLEILKLKSNIVTDV